mgnify:CR=1 FL=1
MNWGELLETLYEKSLDDVNFLQETVTIWDKDEGEYYPGECVEIAESTDILDEGHLFIGIKGDICEAG